MAALTPIESFWAKTRLNARQKLLTAAELRKFPALFATDKTPVAEKIPVAHFFGGPFDFYAVEFDRELGEFFGFTVIGGTGCEGEWGYQSVEALCRSSYRVEMVGADRGFNLGLERDLYWTPRPMREILPKVFGTTPASALMEA